MISVYVSSIMSLDRTSDKICTLNFSVLTWSSETAIIREEGESPNDRNDRGEQVILPGMRMR